MDWLNFFLLGWGRWFTIYVVVQILAAAIVRGKLRLVVLSPAVVMAYVAVTTLRAYQHDSNLWPILMIFASPPIAVITALAGLACWLHQRRRSTAST